MLRRLADQWIESGRAGTVEEPGKRSVAWVSSQYPESILEKLMRFWNANPPRVVIDDLGGRYEIRYEPKSKLDPRQLREDAQNLAIWHFQQFLQSKERDLLAKCLNCAAYFVRKRAPKRDIRIEHGTFCPLCKGKGSAQRTVRSRERQKKPLIELAATMWLECPVRQHGKRSVWVAERMNRKLLAQGVRITGKWVTQNQPQIECEVQQKGENRVTSQEAR